MIFGNLFATPEFHQSDQHAEAFTKIVNIQSILKLSIGAGSIFLVLLVVALFSPEYMQALVGLNLPPFVVVLLISILVIVIVGSSYAIRVANQGNQKLAFGIAAIFIYGSFYASILVSPFGFHDPGMYFISALLIVSSLFVSEATLRIHTVVIIGIFVMAFMLERSGLKQTTWPVPTLYELITVSIAFFLTQLLLTRTIFILRRQSDLLNQQKEEILLYQTKLEDMVEVRTSDLIQEKNKAIRANLAKSQFLANMSHELRTPLNAIIGYGELVIEGLELGNDYHVQQAKPVGPNSIESDVSRIVTAGRNLLDLINHVLDFSKIEANQMTIRIERVDIARVINEAVSLIDPLLAKTGNRIVIREIEPGLRAYGDVQKLRQVLINLIGNANKFTENGSILIMMASAEDEVVISVNDTGIGMKPEFIAQLFQPFMQAESDYSRQFEGTGLGLAISKRFVELMNGRIEVDSVYGNGTSFKIFIPRQSPLNLIKATRKAEVVL